MAEWIVFDGPYVLGRWPRKYAAWIAAKPDKAGRLEEIAGQVLTAVQTSTEVADGFAAADGGGVGLGKTLIPVTKGALTSAGTTNG